MSDRKSKKNIAKKLRKKPNNYPQKGVNHFIPFDELDLEHLIQRYELKNLRLVNEVLYVTTKQRDEFYIEAVYNENIDECVSTLHHKNTKNNTDEYHEELKYFENIFAIFGYIRHHENKLFDGARTPQMRRMSRMEKLFEQIS